MVTFDVAAEAYDRFMGIHSRQLSPQLIELARIGLSASHHQDAPFPLRVYNEGVAL